MQQVFPEGQRLLLTAVLNRIIPAEDALPGAGDLGLSHFVENAVASSPALMSLFTQGLREIEIARVGPEGGQFRDLSPREQDETLKSVESSNPEFFQELVRQTYSGYYTNPQVFGAIGYAPRVPIPGEMLELLDESLLDKQRQRAPFWTKV